MGAGGKVVKKSKAKRPEEDRFVLKAGAPDHDGHLIQDYVLEDALHRLNSRPVPLRLGPGPVIGGARLRLEAGWLMAKTQTEEKLLPDVRLTIGGVARFHHQDGDVVEVRDLDILYLSVVQP